MMTQPAEPLPPFTHRPSPHGNTLTDAERRQAKGRILTSGDQLLVHRFHGRHLCFVAQIDCSGGKSAHADAVRSAARRYFGAGRLVREESVEQADPRLAARWGWSRDNRALARYGVAVDHYWIF